MENNNKSKKRKITISSTLNGAANAGTVEDEITVRADMDNLYKVLAMIDNKLNEALCQPKVKYQIDTAVEEIFANIASYAYPNGPGDATVSIKINNDERMAQISISDSGSEYNPLEKPDPDLGMKIEDRQFGGFGIFMVKNSLDDIRYERKDDKNVLTIWKKI